MAVTLWIALGGALGATLRHYMNVWIARMVGGDFPWHTMLINISGSFVMGALISFMALRWSVGNELRAFLTTGILGGYTTFSAFSLDFAVLVERKTYALAGAYALGSVVVSLAAIFVGMAFARAIA
jgi:fluoride exporter